MDNYFRTTVNEFAKFLAFIEQENPTLTPQRETLGMKDSFKLNMLLDQPKTVKGPHYTQDQYPVIDLMFELALAGRFFVRGKDSKNGKGKLQLLRAN